MNMTSASMQIQNFEFVAGERRRGADCRGDGTAEEVPLVAPATCLLLFK